jgi:hypothetical protein
LADSSDSTYVQQALRVRLDNKVTRIGFPTPSLPAGAKVTSVTLRRRVQTVTPNLPAPVCNHWFRSSTGIIQVAGEAPDILKSFFHSTIPITTTQTWVEENLGTFYTGPQGKAWNLVDPDTGGAGNLVGFTYDIGRGDDFTLSTMRVSAVYLDITYQQSSTVTVTGPTSGTATKPTVLWTYSSIDNQPQQAYRVAIYTQAQYSAPGFTPFVTTPIQSSGTTSATAVTNYWVLGETLQWTLNDDIVDGTYRAYVQATSRWSGSGDFPTSTSFATWSRTVAPANPPVAAVLLSATLDLDNNRIAVTFQPGGPSPATTAFTVQRSSDGGAFWKSIPSLTYVPASGMTMITKYDNTAPLNVDSQYRVISYSGSPFVGAASPSNILTVRPLDTRPWFKHPKNPLLNTPIPWAAPKGSDTGIKITKRQLQGTFYPLGGPGQQVLPFVVEGPSYGDQYDIEMFFDADALEDLWPAVDQIGRTGGTILFQLPDGTQLWMVAGPGGGGQDTTEDFNAMPGNPTKIAWKRRKLTLTQVDDPDYY